MSERLTEVLMDTLPGLICRREVIVSNEDQLSNIVVCGRCHNNLFVLFAPDGVGLAHVLCVKCDTVYCCRDTCLEGRP